MYVPSQFISVGHHASVFAQPLQSVVQPVCHTPARYQGKVHGFPGVSAVLSLASPPVIVHVLCVGVDACAAAVLATPSSIP